MRRLVSTLVLALTSLVSCAGEEERPSIATSGLHQPCPDRGCAVGQECIQVVHPEATVPTCEIACDEDSDCPATLGCNVPPLIPDTVAYICE